MSNELKVYHCNEWHNEYKTVLNAGTTRSSCQHDIGLP